MDTESTRMQCMEIWGGNASVDTSVSVSGLDAWVYSKPYQESAAGGDVHYVSSCATGRITRLLVADVSGHGAEVDEVARGLRDLMRRFVNYLDQSRFVRMMNVQFTEMSRAEIFATAVVMTFFAPTRHLTLCNAGHPAPLWYRAAKGEWVVLEEDAVRKASESEGPSNLPLGIFDISTYEQFEIDLAPGDLVLVYTDSLMEASGSDGKMLGPVGVADVLRGLKVTEPATLIRDLLAALRELHPDNLMTDDVTVMMFRPNGSGEQMAIKDKVLAPVRVLRGLGYSAVQGFKGLPFPEISLVNLGGAMFGPLNRLWRGARRL